ncbi:hypothetical protein [Methyloversatilis sp. RAC08]|uniref:hypothetical protein n=1 Tax=Methyloversatilis sp. RAC08 TaxID=1842540 RepID=UPI0016804317|nr:hypothetical protein [Methyloversatilis sp. RAC08]
MPKRHRVERRHLAVIVEALLQKIAIAIPKASTKIRLLRNVSNLMRCTVRAAAD